MSDANAASSSKAWFPFLGKKSASGASVGVPPPPHSPPPAAPTSPLLSPKLAFPPPPPVPEDPVSPEADSACRALALQLQAIVQEAWTLVNDKRTEPVLAFFAQTEDAETKHSGDGGAKLAGALVESMVLIGGGPGVKKPADVVARILAGNSQARAGLDLLPVLRMLSSRSPDARAASLGIVNALCAFGPLRGEAMAKKGWLGDVLAKELAAHVQDEQGGFAWRAGAQRPGGRER
jgi:hypothetical protein